MAAFGRPFAFGATEWRLGLLENKLDRAEDWVDFQTDTGPSDQREDRADRVEDGMDRRCVEVFDALDRHERRTWRGIATAA